MEPIYVTGHRNPDTDSIVSAMAYAALRNALGDREFVPARLGHISDETRLVLGRFGFEPPIRIQTMRTQVRDLDYDTPPALSGAVTVSRAWTVLQNNRSIPPSPSRTTTASSTACSRRARSRATTCARSPTPGSTGSRCSTS